MSNLEEFADNRGDEKSPLAESVERSNNSIYTSDDIEGYPKNYAGGSGGGANTTPPKELSLILIPLLKGVIYQEENQILWSLLLNFRASVRDYVGVLGLELILDESEGYAFLRSYSVEEQDITSAMPRLVIRRQLSYPVSLLLALLRKKIAEFDAGGSDPRFIMSKDEIVEMVRIFLPEGSNEVKLIDQVDSTINKVAELGFIRRLKTGGGGAGQMIEVRRIIKAFVDAQWLADFDERLAEYRQLTGDESVRRGESNNE